ncbi:hypothetical protein DL96DRAFT_1585576 [Flagelloscypha sp. PMI_526]|nr:hypothetical protein DL96DRAFT_1585576 [Flagelloscypha sp. PMI_526]
MDLDWNVHDWRTTGQDLPNEILAPILQFSSWTLSKSQQLQMMLLCSVAFESISWVFYHDIIIHDSKDGSTLVHLVEAMNRLGSKYFAHRVRALWINIAPSSSHADVTPSHFFGTEWTAVEQSLQVVLSTCRNIRHLRLQALNHLDTLLQSMMALRKLESLSLSRSFHKLEFGEGTSWAELLSGYPTPALSSITHLTIEYVVNGPDTWTPVNYISLFKKLTHICIHITADTSLQSELFRAASALPSLTNVVALNLSSIEYWTQSRIGWCTNPWEWGRDLGLHHPGVAMANTRVVPDEPSFGSMEEWRSVVLGRRFPALAKTSVWERPRYSESNTANPVDIFGGFDWTTYWRSC